MSVLEIHDECDWSSDLTSLRASPLLITDDGAVVFFRLESLVQRNGGLKMFWMTIYLSLADRLSSKFHICPWKLGFFALLYGFGFFALLPFQFSSRFNCQKFPPLKVTLHPFCRDKTEKLMEITEEKKQEIIKKENAK